MLVLLCCAGRVRCCRRLRMRVRVPFVVLRCVVLCCVVLCCVALLCFALLCVALR